MALWKIPRVIVRCLPGAVALPANSAQPSLTSWPAALMAKEECFTPVRLAAIDVVAASL